AEPYIKGEKIKALAIASARRQPGQSLQTFSELGYPGFEVTAWYAIFAAANTPADIVAKLNAEVVKSVENPDLRERLIKLGATPVGSSAQELGAYVRAELDRWGRAVKAATLKLE
ncbi:MAG: tripartite tricarboxylate transporter substrate-binding protein, partial [Pseudomonadota bacterium]